MDREDELREAYWKFNHCREIIRGQMGAMCSIDAYEEYRTAFYAVQAAMDKIKEDETL